MHLHARLHPGTVVTLALAVLWGASACGSSPKTPTDGTASASAAATTGGAPAAVDSEAGPEPEGPPKLSESERGELSGACNLLEPQTYDGMKAARVAVDELYYGDPRAKANDGPPLEAALKVVAKVPSGMSPAEHKRCVELFKKQATREIWEYEPADAAARETLKACQKSAAAMFGKSKLTFGDGSGPTSTSPFCPDGDMVPASLAELPYQSRAADWDTPGWRCMKFGLRASQPFQVAYESTDTEFACIARYQPRGGGGPVELRLGGAVQDSELKLHAKVVRRRLKSAP
ncbi:MAG: hypothetical protein IT373_26000 [Polyangiaceae bacterium]|nr:hypothetical protein [Polyangiaceae bacterium]